MRVLSLNAHDQFGGAEAILQTLRSELTKRGMQMDLAVGERHVEGGGIISLNERDHFPKWSRFCRDLMEWGRPHIPPAWKPRYKHFVANWLAHPVKYFRRSLGHEDFEFPVSRRLLELIPEVPDLIHAHNLNGDYFDLRFLEKLSRQVPVVITLHDHWWLTGHCAHPIQCERWRQGCGSCPDLTLFPSIERDATAYNFQRKQRIAARSRLRVAVPSRWLAKRVADSPIGKQFQECRVIPNGVDLQKFNPGEMREARRLRGLPEGKIALFVAREPERNPFKDYALLRKTLGSVAVQVGVWTLVVVGDSRPDEVIGGVRILYREGSSEEMPEYYRACDFLVHPAKAETYPTVIMEAMACGKPVIASEVGGIPEQVMGWHEGAGTTANGILIPAGSEEALTAALVKLFSDEPLRAVLGRGARLHAEQNFDQRRMVDLYDAWYQELLGCK